MFHIVCVVHVYASVLRAERTQCLNTICTAVFVFA